MKIILPGDPVAQTRMKYSGRHGFGRMYDPKDKEKKVIRKQMTDYVKRFYKDFKFLEHPRISFVFHMAIPKGVRKKDLALFNSGLHKHEKKPDADNLVKLYLDCMDGIVFEGDQKVTLGPSPKLYHPHPKTVIILNETVDVLSPLEVDPMTWYALFGEESGTQTCAEMDVLDDSYTPTHLIPTQLFDTSFPRQSVGTFEPPPTALRILQLSELRLREANNRKARTG